MSWTKNPRCYTFYNRLKARHFNESLTQKPTFSMQEMKAKVEWYIKREEINAEKRIRDAKRRQGTRWWKVICNWIAKTLEYNTKLQESNLQARIKAFITLQPHLTWGDSGSLKMSITPISFSSPMGPKETPWGLIRINGANIIRY